MRVFKKNLVLIFFIKFLVLIIFSSEFNRFLFYPFVKTFVNLNLNPWQYYIDNNLNIEAFPYPALMLYILFPFSVLASLFETYFIFKIPLLIADLLIFYVLVKLFPQKKLSILFYYFLNPIVFYAIYIHSQLDIIPTAILIFSVYQLIKKNYTYSSILSGLAIASKAHIVISIPLIVFYLYKNEKINTLIKYITISIIVVIAINIPFVFSEGFVKMVLFNSKQSLVFDSFYDFGKVKFLFPLASILLVYFHFFNQKKVNNDLLFFYFGILFTIVIFFIYPSPAWYVWMIPFVSIYLINSSNKKKTILLYSLLTLSYLIFFILFYKSDYKEIMFLGKYVSFKIDSPNLMNISFTILEVALLLVMYAFYKFGIKSNSIYKKSTNLAIGIAGDSAVGKSNLLNNLYNFIGKDKLLQIEGDGEHKWERGNENWNNFTHLNPKANYIHKQSDAIISLKNNKSIYRSDYDHSIGKFTEAKKVIPKKFILIAGLHPFYLPRIRKIMDIKIYIDTDEKLRQHWKVIRDFKKRGHSKGKIFEQIKKRTDDAKKYIYPQKKFADLIIMFFPKNNFQVGNEAKEIDLGLKVTLDANINIEKIIESLNCKLEWDYNKNLKTQYIILKNKPSVNYYTLATKNIDNINEIINQKLEFNEGYDGFIQLICLKMISEKLKEEDNNEI